MPLWPRRHSGFCMSFCVLLFFNVTSVIFSVFSLFCVTAFQPHRGLHRRLSGIHGHEWSILTSGIYILLPLLSDKNRSGNVWFNIHYKCEAAYHAYENKLN